MLVYLWSISDTGGASKLPIPCVVPLKTSHSTTPFATSSLSRSKFIDDDSSSCAMSPCRTKSHEMIQTESPWPSTLNHTASSIFSACSLRFSAAAVSWPYLSNIGVVVVFSRYGMIFFHVVLYKGKLTANCVPGVQLAGIFTSYCLLLKSIRSV